MGGKSKSSADNSISSNVTNTQQTTTNQTDNSDNSSTEIDYTSETDSSTNNSNNSSTEIDSSIDLDAEFGIVGSGNSVTQISTDQGAVEAGRRIGEAAIDLVGENQRNVNDTLSGAVDRSLDFGDAALEQSFQFGGMSLDLAGKALDVQAETTSKGFGSLSSAIDKASQATRSDTADTLQKIAKYGAIAGGLVMVVIIGLTFRNRSA